MGNLEKHYPTYEFLKVLVEKVSLQIVELFSLLKLDDMH